MYYLPVKICAEADGMSLYHYCCCLYPGYRVWPVGFCSLGCPGHESKAEAREHYRQFLIDRCGQYSGRLHSPAACALCGRSTAFFAWIDYHFEWEIVTLCPVHLNREGLLNTVVLKDYHLLQISDPRSVAVVTVTGSDGAISIVTPGDSAPLF